MNHKLIRISYKGSSETPLHFIFRYKGNSVGRYRRYPVIRYFEQKVELNILFYQTSLPMLSAASSRAFCGNLRSVPIVMLSIEI